MQSAETVLGVLRERGRRGLSCDELYRQMSNPQLYLLAYGRIYANHGAMTPGVTKETDDMSQRKIGRIIDAIRHERYRFRPVRRVNIPKKNGKTRPLGLPTWSDKLVGEVVRLLLEAYYEPTFSSHSHGFRPRKGCHTALREVDHTWTGTSWFVEGAIADCFGSLDHDVLLSILGEKIHDNRFLRLVRNMLTAGYVEDWRWGATLSGAPQGGVASPILSNIYLHKLDEFVEKVLIFEARIERKNRSPLVARFGGIPLQRKQTAEVVDREPVRVDYPQKELAARLLADTCEICGSRGNVQVHHVRALADLAHAGWQPSDWVRVMLHRRRKTVVACDTCHNRIHSERPAKPLT
ncbi:reverse transcriptase/maturase family protein [Streptomyces sp. NPDC032198]|uniref:reverse transcriptase/maturase family protein n=1 Tax=Streptomyces sp. NPDC032198 TaxID=3155127 RepID=UPI0033CA197F